MLKRRQAAARIPGLLKPWAPLVLYRETYIMPGSHQHHILTCCLLQSQVFPHPQKTHCPLIYNSVNYSHPKVLNQETQVTDIIYAYRLPTLGCNPARSCKLNNLQLHQYLGASKDYCELHKVGLAILEVALFVFRAGDINYHTLIYTLGRTTLLNCFEPLSG